MALLEVDSLNAGYHGMRVLHDLSLQVGERQIVVVIGPNGAGKSTLLKAIAGLAELQRGAIRYRGQAVAGKPPEALTRMGIALVPQEESIFPSLSVRENLMVSSRFADGRVGEDLESVFALFPVLRERAFQRAGTLSGGERQMLAIGCALMTRPHLLLLDEPSGGLAPMLVSGLFQHVQAISRRTGTAILMVEQSARLALSVADRGYVLEGGRIRFSGPAAALMERSEVVQRYLGV